MLHFDTLLPTIRASGAGQPHGVLLLLIQLVVIIVCSRLLGLLFRSIRQPLVIGEIVAGIMLGPSLLGQVSPALAAWLFPPDSTVYLHLLAQIGLIFFMFLVGLQFNPRELHGQVHAAVLISHAGIIIPFGLGMLLAVAVQRTLAPAQIPLSSFSLFMGVSMSVTAFPVLARILSEHNLHQTRLGSIALTCAAVDDITAWCLLALVVAIVRSGSVLAALPTMVFSMIYIALMLSIGRRALAWLVDRIERRCQGQLPQSAVALLLAGVLCSAGITELIGIHALFGAFLFGTIVPRQGAGIVQLGGKIEDLTAAVLLPLFFAYTGLHTELRLLTTVGAWVTCGVLILVASLGKFGGSLLASRLVGIGWREAAMLGVLMNTRGLMELIVLNIGLEIGVISPRLFTMLVLMALVTTLLTAPILSVLSARPRWGRLHPLRQLTD